MPRISKSLSPLRKAYGIVSYRGVPVYRCQAWLLELVKHRKGVEPVILSGIRDDPVIAEHNRKYGTNLHGQQWLVNAHARDPLHFASANSTYTTSHCHHADGNVVYGPSGSNIPLVMNGIDALDNSTAARIRAAANALGFRVALPYNTGSELHHFSPWPHDGHVADYVKRLRREYIKLLPHKARKRIRRKK